jgi:hypothetical protein
MVRMDHRGKKLSTVHGEPAHEYRINNEDRAVRYKTPPDRMEKFES